MQFKEVCKNWSSQRNQELQWVTFEMRRTLLRWSPFFSALKLSQTMQAMSISDKNSSPTPNQATPSQLSKTVTSSHPAATRKPQPGKSSLGLPSINSSEWDFEELTLPPAPQSKKWSRDFHCEHCFTELQKYFFLHFIAVPISPIAQGIPYCTTIISASVTMLCCVAPTKIAWLECAERY